MAIAINHRNESYARTSLHPEVVPPAAVWEPGQRLAGAGRPAGSGCRVRTLLSDDRTIPSISHRSGLAPGIPPSASNTPATAGKEGVKGNYLLGAVFGIAVFLGTLFAGLSGGGNASDVDAGSGFAPTGTPLTVRMAEVGVVSQGAADSRATDVGTADSGTADSGAMDSGAMDSGAVGAPIEGAVGGSTAK